MTTNDGQCNAPPVAEKSQRAIPAEIDQLAISVKNLEFVTDHLAERLQNGSIPPPAPSTGQEAENVRPPHACPVAEAITQLTERVTSVRDHIDDLCERVQL